MPIDSNGIVVISFKAPSIRDLSVKIDKSLEVKALGNLIDRIKKLKHY